MAHVCEYEIGKKRVEAYTGEHIIVDICTLTGRACFIEDRDARESCDRRLFALQYSRKYATEGNGTLVEGASLEGCKQSV